MRIAHLPWYYCTGDPCTVGQFHSKKIIIKKPKSPKKLNKFGCWPGSTFKNTRLLRLIFAYCVVLHYYKTDSLCSISRVKVGHTLLKTFGAELALLGSNAEVQLCTKRGTEFQSFQPQRRFIFNTSSTWEDQDNCWSLKLVQKGRGLLEDLGLLKRPPPSITSAAIPSSTTQHKSLS